MGLYLSAEFWLARTGVGVDLGREETEDGAVERSRGRGEVMAVP